jgi:hypothetical protein
LNETREKHEDGQTDKLATYAKTPENPIGGQTDHVAIFAKTRGIPIGGQVMSVTGTTTEDAKTPSDELDNGFDPLASQWDNRP